MLMIKEFEKQKVEILKINEQILFNANQVGECLDIIRVRDTLRNFDKDEKVLVTNEYISTYSAADSIRSRIFNNMGEIFLTEAGLYKLIFISRKPCAEKFQKWVTSEILPDIRKHGLYATDDAVEKFINNPDTIIKILEAYKEEKRQKEIAIKAKNKIGAGREATAMATASNAIQKLTFTEKKLQETKEKLDEANEELGLSQKFASILRVTLAIEKTREKTTRKKFYDWHLLKRISKILRLEIKKIPDLNYGEVNINSALAWKKVYRIDLKKLFEKPKIKKIQRKFKSIFDFS